MLQNAHAQALPEILQALAVDTKHGLSQEKVKQLRRQYGSNALKQQNHISIIKLFLEQFSSILVLLLIAAGIFSYLIHEVFDAVTIFVIILLNGLFGFAQEFKAERSLEELKNAEEQTAIVLRDGEQKEINVTEVVPGDILVLQEGKRVAADARLIEAVELAVDESLLTGESIPANKQVDKLPLKTALADRRNMLFSASVITRGRGLAVVVATGMQTEVGKLAGEIQAVKSEPTPLQEALNVVGRVFAVVSLLVALPGIGIGLYMGRELGEMVLTAISLAVSVVPEGLPVVVTIALALGIKKMLKAKVLVRKLSTAESLGGVDVICTDKTGTITHNQMTVTNIFVKVAGHFTVTGKGYSTTGSLQGEKKQAVSSKQESEVRDLLEQAVLCSEAELDYGDPTERSMVVALHKLAGDAKKLRAKAKRLSEIPFSSNKKYMAVVTNHVTVKPTLIVKGAAEVVLDMCAATAAEKKQWLAINQDYASKGLRVLAVASKVTTSQKKITEKDLHKLQFVGLVAMYDPPRDEVHAALIACKKAGIKVLMLTGDHQSTAEVIAEQVGFEKLQSSTGVEIEDLSDADFATVLKRTNVFARVTAQHKLRILKTLQDQGHQVAMIGDGVNDSIAIKKADVGVSVGSGTDLAKGVSDMVLLDDNFASIVDGVREARHIFFNIKKFIRFLTSANFDEVAKVLTSIIFALPLPFIPLHILWINLATDSLPAIALATDVAEKDLMQKKPYQPKKEIMIGVIPIAIFVGIIGYLSSYLLFLYALHHWGASVEYARTLSFTSSVFFELILIFAIRSEKSALSIGLFSNPTLILSLLPAILMQLLIIYHPLGHRIFETVSLDPQDWFWVLLASVSGFFFVELAKQLRKIFPFFRVIVPR